MTSTIVPGSRGNPEVMGSPSAAYKRLAVTVHDWREADFTEGWHKRVRRIAAPKESVAT